ncbi:MAG: hypothetical protein AB4058_13605 [Microcystaceae cyanobacterium]
MSSQHSFTNFLFFSLKGFLTTIVVLGILFGYPEKIVYSYIIAVGSYLMAQSTQQMIHNNTKDQHYAS